MDAARAAYWNLISLARTDGAMPHEERLLLDRYRSALGIGDVESTAIQQEAMKHPPGSTQVGGSDEEREHVLHMMAMLAYADGDLSPNERARLERVAHSLGIGPAEYADILVSAQEEVLAPRLAARRAYVIAGTVATVALVLGEIAWYALRPAPSAPTEDSSQAAHRLVERYDSSVFLLYAQCRFLRGTEEKTIGDWGTGFLVTQDGVVATCKHVVQPWKYERGAGLVADGWKVDERSVILAAWAAGSRLEESGKGYDASASYSTKNNLLSLVATAPDGREEANGSQSLDASDLALLRVQLSGKLEPLPLADDLSALRKTDPILAIGYPGGRESLERANVETSTFEGTVQRIEDSLFITNPTLPGASGGPAFDVRRGRVVGVVARKEHDSTLGRCIPIQHVRALLASAGIR